jgi:hypothetical protein
MALVSAENPFGPRVPRSRGLPAEGRYYTAEEKARAKQLSLAQYRVSQDRSLPPMPEPQLLDV